MKKAKHKIALFLFTIFLMSSLTAASVQAATASSMYVLLYLDQTTAFVGKEQIQLDTPPKSINGKLYVPTKFLGDALGFPVVWDSATSTVVMKPPGYTILLDTGKKKVYVNGQETPFDSVATIVNGSLLVKVTWITDYLGASYTYNTELKRVEILYTKPAASSAPSYAPPVAKFMTGKSVYKLGEPITYVNTSYDPNKKALNKNEWTGNKEAFFTPGTYPVTLQVTNSAGLQSETYTRNITVSEEHYLTELEYPFYTTPVGGVIKSTWEYVWKHFTTIPALPVEATSSTDRTLLVSDSPEMIEEKGILYQDTINGKARFYADHLNDTDETLIFAILATNNTDKPITLTTTNKGEVYPSIYANLIGSVASVDFLMRETYNEKIVIPPNETYVYSRLPDYYPGQGTNLIYDVESSGELQISFIANDTLTKDTLSTLKPLFSDLHVRGTFPVSTVDWKVDGSGITKPSKLVIGNGTTDPFVKGYDALKQKESLNFGNWGVDYNIHMENPPRMAVMVIGKGGYFKGPFRINDEMIQVPKSGLLTAFEDIQVLAKTTGKEKSLDIVFTPPAGSNFPVDLIFYPLDDLEAK
ncbi:stalk domain-containing protein [Paenibacillus eucommiae]|uniref:PKD repeat protein n=1 Tax=Paenibacillus eucommiae TaxID=1355755 RepID=A0ABS4JEC0_9BACL|nr:stalk domain-containing protein [Paenibacillus eucommiae]MBP1997079.1 PKD repeat protein [Paenibacillus eucommiae]